MKKRWLGLVFVLALIFAACGSDDTTSDDDATTTTAAATTTEAPATTEEATTTTTEAMAEIGSEEHPIKVLFVPSVEADVIVTGGEIMQEALETATGLSFEVVVPTSYAVTIEEMCASPEDTIGFIPGLGYVLGRLCECLERAHGKAGDDQAKDCSQRHPGHASDAEKHGEAIEGVLDLIERAGYL